MAELVSVKEDHARTKSEMESIREQHTRTKAELDALKEDHMNTKAELEHAKSKIQQGEKQLHDLKAEANLSNSRHNEPTGLKASLASSSSRMIPTNVNGNPSELDEIRKKLQVAESTIEEMKAQLASTSANLDALIGSKVPRNMIEVIDMVIAAHIDEAEAPAFAGRPVLRRFETSDPRDAGSG